VVRLRGDPHPVDQRIAVRHAVAFTVGCLTIVLGNELIRLPHISWGVLAFCLMFLPMRDEATGRVRYRIIGTVIGAIAATAIAAVSPSVVCLALAAVCGTLTVAYALTPEAYLLYVSFPDANRAVVLRRLPGGVGCPSSCWARNASG
jgi:uncharacterized membrane protein YccC